MLIVYLNTSYQGMDKTNVNSLILYNLAKALVNNTKTVCNASLYAWLNYDQISMKNCASMRALIGIMKKKNVPEVTST